MVDSLITTRYQTNEDRAVHNVASCNDEVVEVWTSQPNNPEHH